jgi:tyrosinase
MARKQPNKQGTMNHWNHIPHEDIPKDGFTRLTLAPEDIKSQIEALPAPPAPPPLSADVLKLKQKLSTLTASADVAAAGAKQRLNQKDLPRTEKDAFKNALSKLVTDGTYKPLVNIHANMSHNMHGSMGPIGLLRFLAWHRRYILEFERALIAADKALRPNATTPVCLPYWHWIDPFPDWLEGFLPAKRPDNNRPPPARRKKSPPEKPNQTDVNYIVSGFASQMRGVNTDDYTRFTYGLEGWGQRPDGRSLPAHNHVHDWTGGIMSNTIYSPTDPVFWLHHGEVDRFWHIWQQQNGNSHPALTGNNRIMDPWPETYDDLRSIEALRYVYASNVP